MADLVPSDINPTAQVKALADLYEIPATELKEIHITDGVITFIQKSEIHAYGWSWEIDEEEA